MTRRNAKQMLQTTEKLIPKSNGPKHHWKVSSFTEVIHSIILHPYPAIHSHSLESCAKSHYHTDNQFQTCCRRSLPHQMSQYRHTWTTAWLGFPAYKPITMLEMLICPSHNTSVPPVTPQLPPSHKHVSHASTLAKSLHYLVHMKKTADKSRRQSSRRKTDLSTSEQKRLFAFILEPFKNKHHELLQA